MSLRDISEAPPTLIQLLAAHWLHSENLGMCECGAEFGHWDDWAVHLNELIEAAYLVVPRSDVIGTEYGWREGPDDQVCPRDRREYAEITVEKRGRGEAVARPSLPWTLITERPIE